MRTNFEQLKMRVACFISGSFGVVLHVNGFALYDGVQAALVEGDIFHAKSIVRQATELWWSSQICGDGLVWATMENEVDMDVVDLIINEGVSIDAVSSVSATALESATSRGSTDVVYELLVRGANPSFKHGRRRVQTALVSAAFKNDLVIVKMMVDFGADIEDITCLSDSTLARVHGDVLRYIRGSGGRFSPFVEGLLDARAALGD